MEHFNRNTPRRYLNRYCRIKNIPCCKITVGLYLNKKIRAILNPIKSLSLVGMTGFEPAASWSQTRRSTKLSHIPILFRKEQPYNHALYSAGALQLAKSLTAFGCSLNNHCGGRTKPSHIPLPFLKCLIIIRQKNGIVNTFFKKISLFYNVCKKSSSCL